MFTKKLIFLLSSFLVLTSFAGVTNQTSSTIKTQVVPDTTITQAARNTIKHAAENAEVGAVTANDVTSASSASGPVTTTFTTNPNSQTQNSNSTYE
ncbi:MAG: hypothetical protein ACOYL6_11425 [Bacteriovoracaceae bacterium]